MDAFTKPERDQIEVARAKVQSMLDEGRGRDAVDALFTLLLQLQRDNGKLLARVRDLLRRLYGKKSEKSDPEQLALLLELLDKDADSKDPKANEGNAAAGTEGPEPPATPPTPQDPPKPPPPKGRKPLPKLPRRKIDIAVPADQRPCPVCGGDRVACGFEVAELIAFVPGHFEIIEESREKLVCRPCEAITTAPLGPRVLEGARPDVSLVADIIVRKHGDGLPLYRIAGIYHRVGVSFSPATIGDWNTYGVELLTPLAERISDKAFGSGYVRGDDTGISVLDRDALNGKKRGHLFAYVGGGVVSFKYTPNWTAEDGPEIHLRGYEGCLQCDGYSGFASVASESKGKIQLCGCHMHSRRKFEAAMIQGKDARAALAMSLYRRIYHAEDEGRSLAPAERLAFRLERVKPVLDELAAWVDQVHPGLVPGSLLYKATTYFRNQRDALYVPFSLGHVELDNGAVERALKYVAMGRKAYLFAGSDAGGQRLAIAYSVEVSAKLHHLDLYAYTTDALRQLGQPGWRSRLDNLLPDVWAATHPEHVHPPPRRDESS